MNLSEEKCKLYENRLKEIEGKYLKQLKQQQQLQQQQQQTQQQVNNTALNNSTTNDRLWHSKYNLRVAQIPAFIKEDQARKVS